MSQFTFGWKPPENPPHVGLNYRAVRGVESVLPSETNNRANDTPIRDQGQLGSCTAFGWKGAVEFYLRNVLKLSTVEISALFVYFNERNYDGTTADDVGASVGDGAEVVSKIGACVEALWPYDVTRYADLPPKPAYDDAATRLFPQPLSVDTADQDAVKTVLSRGDLLVFGQALRESFQDVPSRGQYYPSGTVIGGHCTAVVDYNPFWVMVRNSWDTSWGENGYYDMTWADFSRYAQDAWVIPRPA